MNNNLIFNANCFAYLKMIPTFAPPKKEGEMGEWLKPAVC